MKNVTPKLAVVFLIASTTGCAAIFHGTSQTIQANSAPAAAMVKTEPGNLQFTTPASLTLERKNSYILTFTRDGYSPATFQIQKKLSVGMLVLDLFTSGVGIVVDAVTGAWYDLTPTVASVALEKKTASVDGPDRIEITIQRTNNGLKFESSSPGVSVKADQE